MSWLITWDRVGPFGGKGRPMVGKVEECDVVSRHLQNYSPRLCRLRTDGLAPREQVLNIQVACWWNGPSKPSSLPSIDAWLKPTTSMVGFGEKLMRVPRATQQGWEVESGALFLGSGSIHPTLLMTHEMLLHANHVRYVWSRAIREPSVECVWCVGRVFPCKVYINLNYRDSWIWVTVCLMAVFT
jgi:hypothetical protein